MGVKAILCNVAAMRTKYGETGWTRVAAALDGLVRADGERGQSSRVLDLSDAREMARLGGRAVGSARDAKGAKAAVDAVARALAPDYLLLLGAPDTFPHQRLRNPLFAPPEDPDRHALSDLPYACEAPASDDPRRFVGPTRVVGRLPDVAGARDPARLVRSIATAAAWRSRPASAFRAAFAVSAAEWAGSSSATLRRLLAHADDLRLSPPGGPRWPRESLRRRMHFVNCHGSSEDPRWYGQRGDAFPVALAADRVEGRLARGTVASVECCYGAQLYDPEAAGTPTAGLANAYLDAGAYGFFGSTTIAYGPAAGNAYADVLCRFVLERILAGASLGRAALEARQRFAAGAAELDPVDLKTLAQFVLLGDPSIHPVAPPPAPTGAADSLPVATPGSARTERRRRLLVHGRRIQATQAAAVPTVAVPPRAVRSLARRLRVRGARFLAFDVAPASPGGARSGRSLARKGPPEPAARLHVALGRANGPRSGTRVLVARTVGRSVVSFRLARNR